MIPPDRLASFDRPVHALVVGASGGIGQALAQRLLEDTGVAQVTALSRTPLAVHHAKHRAGVIDILDEASIAAAVADIGEIDLAIVATGLLHAGIDLQPEKSLRSLQGAALTQLFAVNAIGPALVAKHVVPLMPRDRRAVFAALSARVGSITDNQIGGWYGYRAAKAALNQLIRTLSIEVATNRHQAVVVALHPGTVDTGLSKPFQRMVRPGQMVSAAQAATHLLTVIDGLTPADTGGLFAWDGARIAY